MIDTILNKLLDAALDGVIGFLAPDEPAFLASLAATCPPETHIVEVGAYCGRSTIALACGAPDGVLVYSVDPHDEHVAGGHHFGMTNNQAFMANVSRAGLGHKVRVLNLPSWDAATALYGVPLGLVFIDGNHESMAPQSDIHAWSSHLVTGGVLAIHDSTGAWLEPTRAADRLAKTDGWQELSPFGYTRTFRKVTE